jgi:hypothetical protein
VKAPAAPAASSIAKKTALATVRRPRLPMGSLR